MLLRKARFSELVEYLTANPCHSGAEFVGHDRAIAIWRSLFHNPAFSCSVIQATTASGCRPVALCGTVFVYPWIIDDELADPQPGLTDRIVQKILSGQPVALNEPEIRAGNTHPGLNVVSLCSWEKQLLSPEQGLEAQLLVAYGVLANLTGYRLNRVIAESVDDEEAKFLGNSHCWRAVAAFGDRRSALWLMTKQTGLETPWSIAAMMFHYREPVLHLHSSDQQLLLAALDGMTDQELSDKLGLHLGTIKKRWISLFERVTDAHMNVLPEMTAYPRNRRGPQKRHRVLAYVRAHPEELRAFDIRLYRPAKQGQRHNGVALQRAS